MGWWKELNCAHVYKTEESIFLRKVRLSDGMSMPTYSNYEIYGDVKVCLKCDKKDIEERKVLII